MSVIQEEILSLQTGVKVWEKHPDQKQDLINQQKVV